MKEPRAQSPPEGASSRLDSGPGCKSEYREPIPAPAPRPTAPPEPSPVPPPEKSSRLDSGSGCRTGRAASSLVVAALLLAAIALVAGACAGTRGDAPAPPVLIDSMDDVAAWTALPADGVAETISAGEGYRGRGLRIDFDFGGGGWAIARRALDLDLPANYEFRFRLRGQGPPQQFEFKLIDAGGRNVWWSVQREVEWPARWQLFRVRKRQLGFAWGPAGGGELGHAAALELAVTAGAGGSGTVWIDELELAPLPAPGGPVPEPLATASSARAGGGAALAVDGDPATAWTPAADDPAPWLELDLGIPREFSALRIDWAGPGHWRDYLVEATDEPAAAGAEGDTAWAELARQVGANGGRDDVFLLDGEARRLRLRRLPAPDGGGPEITGAAIAGIALRPPDWAPDRNAFFERLAAEVPRGLYPRGFSGEQAYWTVVGIDADPREALLSEDGALEAGPGRFRIEPFVWLDAGEEGGAADAGGRDDGGAPGAAGDAGPARPARAGRLLTWADGETRHDLVDDELPIPVVRRRVGDLELEAVAFADGTPGAAVTIVRYAVRNLGDGPIAGTLYLALRPFQVDPPTQTLNLTGGAAPIRELALTGRSVAIDGESAVLCLEEPAGRGATTFAGGEIVSEHLAAGRLPGRTGVADPFAAASGALAWPLDLAPGAERRVHLVVPLYPGPDGPGLSAIQPPAPQGDPDPWFGVRLAAARDRWRERAGRVRIELPDEAGPLLETLRAQVGWILVNRAGPALQPGPRSYARSWIRDGALTGSALLRLGLPEVVREFLLWYAPYQYPDGKVPCVVDRRGADPVPEHDSGGELIFLVAEDLRRTGDRRLAERLWPHVRAAAAYLDSLRHRRLTPEYDAADLAEFRGLLPPSISHEGYSAAPMHSYWDDLFALRGFRDAAWLAAELGHGDEAARLARIAGEFGRDLRASVEAAMARHGIDYVPGAADLGDFDPTSTSIALAPLDLADALPPEALRRTFERYWDFFRERRDGEEWDAYTPYEIRNVSAFVRLGWRERAAELLDFFLDDRRPPGWRQWPEVVRRDPRRPGFLGDLPHTWVGSDFARAALDLLAYVDRSEGTLVLAAGVPWRWLAGGGEVVVAGMPTPWGELGYRLRREGPADEAGSVRLEIDGGLSVPPGGMVVAAPPPGGPAAGPVAVTVDGVPVVPDASGRVVVRAVPATVLLSP